MNEGQNEERVTVVDRWMQNDGMGEEQNWNWAEERDYLIGVRSDQ
jgi:hypothetical protein